MSIYNSEFYKENLTKIFNAPHTLLQKEFKNIPCILNWIDLVVNRNNQSISSTLYIAAATPIQYSTTVAGNSDGMYRIDVAVERLD